jgi:predicted MFS family arabinose efflux permease
MPASSNTSASPWGRATGDGGPGHGTPGLRRALAGLCVTEITSWGVLYYSFPVVLVRLTRATGWPASSALSAFSAGLVVSALAGVPVGRLLDHHGPRTVMTAGSAAGTCAALAIAAAPSLPWFFAAWMFAGLAQSALLYPPAFSALTRWYGPRRVRALTTLSLVAGLASTVFAPLTAALVDRLSWRATYVVLAMLLAAVTIPGHALCLTPAWPGKARDDRGHERAAGHIRTVVRDRAFPFLVAAMVLAAFGMYAATVDLVPLVTSQGTGNTPAAAALALVGAGQVAGRLGYAALARRTSPRGRTMVILTAGAVTIALFAVALLAGAARGTYTLLQATAVSDRWGIRDFPTVNGIFSAPTTIAMAVAPAGGALLAAQFGSYPAAFYLLAGLTFTGAALAARTRAGCPAPGRGEPAR